MCEIEALNKRHEQLVTLIEQTMDMNQKGMCESGISIETNLWQPVMTGLTDLLAFTIARQMLESGSELDWDDIVDTGKSLANQIVLGKINERMKGTGVTVLGQGILAVDLDQFLP